PNLSPYAKEYMVADIIYDLGNMRCFHEFKGSVGRGRAICGFTIVCAAALGQFNRVVYYLLSTLANTKTIKPFNCDQIVELFSKYQRTPANFDTPDGWVSKLFVYETFIGTYILPDITIEML